MSDNRGKRRKLPTWERSERDDVEIPANAVRHGMAEELVTRRAVIAIRPTSYDEQAGTVEAEISRGTGVLRTDARGRFVERLNLSRVDLDSLEGIPVLDGHQNSASRHVVGIVTSARRDGDAIVAVIRLSQADDVSSQRTKIIEGVIRAVSIGYGVASRAEAIIEGQRVATIHPLIREVSIVAIGADPHAKIRSKTPMADETENDVIERPEADEPTVTETRAAIRSVARAAGLPNTWADEQIDAESTVAEAEAAAFRAMQERRPRHIRTAAPQEDMATRAQAAEDGLFMRHGGAAPEDATRTEAAQAYTNMTLRDHARACVIAAGQNARTMSDDTLFRAAMTTTSDFPNLLLGVGRRTLLASYRAAESALKRLARQGSRVDFRPGSALRLGEIGALQKVSEAGEIKHVSRSESVESYALDTYGALFTISRKALVNDDLNAFGDWSRAAGAAAAQTEADVLWSLISQAAGAGPVMGDTKRLFSADHGNLMTGAGLSVEALSDARLALRNTKGLDGKTVIAATPKFLLVGPELETQAEQLLASIYAGTTADVNPFSQKLTLLVEPRITDDSWYVWADPAQLPILEYSYLSSAPGPQVSQREGWETLSREFRVYEDFGAGAIGWRGAVRNPGA